MTNLAAKRWAKALMDLAVENQGISKEDILDDLREIISNFDASEELSNVISNPSVSVEEKQIVLCKIFQSNLMPIVYNFLYVLNLRKRLDILREIADEFEKEIEKFKNIVRVEITSAFDLSNEYKDDIKNKIAEKLKKNIKTEWKVDSNIIAGLIFNINDNVVDNSVKHKLDKLSENIIKV